MIHLIKFIVLICTVLLSHTVYASSVSDIDELISRYDSAKCVLCHEDIAPTWMHSSHATSVINNEVIKAVNSVIHAYSKSDVRSTIKECLFCHAPQVSSASDSLIDHIGVLILIAANDNSTERKNNAMEKLSQLNLNCRICHMIKGIPDNSAKSNIIWGPGWDEHEQSHSIEYGFDTLKSDYLTSARFCKSCHSGYDHQFEGSENLIAKVKCIMKDAASKNCQDCHINIDHSFSTATPPVK